MILSVIDRIYQLFEYKFFSGEQSNEINQKRFDVIKNKVQNAKIIICKLDQIAVTLLILTNQTNYFMT